MTNEQKNNDLEKKLAKLQPAKNDNLMSSILTAAEAKIANESQNGNGKMIAFPEISPCTTTPTSHASCFASTLPFLTGAAGLLIGAAAMFFGMTFLMSPQIEIREVVRIVTPTPQTETPHVAAPLAEQTITPGNRTEKESPETVGPTNQSETPPNDSPWEQNQPSNWLFSLLPISLKPINRERITDSPIDLDALLAERETNVKRMLANNTKKVTVQPVRYSRDLETPRISPAEYREMLESLTQ